VKDFYRQAGIPKVAKFWIARDTDWTGMAEWRFGFISKWERQFHFKFSTWKDS
jgi:hypothetical protein